MKREQGKINKTVRLESEMEKQIQDVADKLGLKFSDVVRMSVRMALPEIKKSNLAV